MLQDAHKALESMSAATTAIKDEMWSKALVDLNALQSLLSVLMRDVGDKDRQTLQAPQSNQEDRE